MSEPDRSFARAARIALIHATPLSIRPIEDAFARGWPQDRPAPVLINILEDSLSRDRAATLNAASAAEAAALDAAIDRRFVALGDYAASLVVDAILFTCSAFGPAIERVQRRLGLPVYKPNQAMLDAALDRGARVGLVATFAATVEPMSAELRALAKRRGVELTLYTELAAGAMERLADGDADGHDRMIADTAAGLPEVDVIVLAQYSMARARPAVETVADAPVLTSSDCAVAALATTLGRASGAGV